MTEGTSEQVVETRQQALDGVIQMNTPDISFKPLWKMLIDRDISRHELQMKAGVSRSTMWKMGRNDYVSLDVITKICKALDCSIDQIIEII